MRSIEFQPAAKVDLLEAWLQVAHHRGVNAADTYLSKLRALCELIANQPGMGVDRPDVADGVLSFPVDSHVVGHILAGIADIDQSILNIGNDDN